MPSNEDILRSAPAASFNGALDKFRHSLSPDRPRSTTASPLKRRYADPEGDDEHEAEAHTLLIALPPARQTHPLLPIRLALPHQPPPRHHPAQPDPPPRRRQPGPAHRPHGLR
ncbi:hypothetical protein LOZ32_006132, partial [Ophidiomyces ophidiicola]